MYVGPSREKMQVVSKKNTHNLTAQFPSNFTQSRGEITAGSTASFTVAQSKRVSAQLWGHRVPNKPFGQKVGLYAEYTGWLGVEQSKQLYQ